MSIYDYYYIGDQEFLSDTFGDEQPLLLAFSKIQSGVKSKMNFHMHAYTEFFYFVSGSGYFETSSKRYRIEPNTLLVVNANNLHIQYSDDETHPMTYINFTVDNIQMRGCAPNSISNNSFEIYAFTAKKNKIYLTLANILQELKQKNFGFYNKVHAHFIQILIDIIRIFQELKDDSSANSTLSYKSNLHDIKKYINEHYYENIALDDLAKMVYLSKSYFLHQFKLLFNVSPMQYLTNVRIEQSKLLLAKTTESITEIATAVGYGNPAYFAEIFKKVMRISPTLYRKITTSDRNFSL